LCQNMSVWMYVYMCVCTYIYIYVCVYIYIYVCVCVCIYIYISCSVGVSMHISITKLLYCWSSIDVLLCVQSSRCTYILRRFQDFTPFYNYAELAFERRRRIYIYMYIYISCITDVSYLLDVSFGATDFLKNGIVSWLRRWNCKVLWNFGNADCFAPCHLFQGGERQYYSRSNFTFVTGFGLPIFSIYIPTDIKAVFIYFV
jgi:hypothetical protein